MYQPYYGGEYLIEKWSILKFKNSVGGPYESTLVWYPSCLKHQEGWYFWHIAPFNVPSKEHLI